jgi:hypothetical protein
MLVIYVTFKPNKIVKNFLRIYLELPLKRIYCVNEERQDMLKAKLFTISFIVFSFVTTFLAFMLSQVA